MTDTCEGWTYSSKHPQPRNYMNACGQLPTPVNLPPEKKLPVFTGQSNTSRGLVTVLIKFRLYSLKVNEQRKVKPAIKIINQLWLTLPTCFDRQRPADSCLKEAYLLTLTQVPFAHCSAK